MMSVLCVGAGGFVGAVSRYGLGLIPLGSELPLMTLLINFVGSVIIGAVVEAASLAPNALPLRRLHHLLHLLPGNARAH